VGDDLRLDMIVESKVVIELKAVKDIEPIHEAQLLTYSLHARGISSP
jgi:GxxExxY protein